MDGEKCLAKLLKNRMLPRKYAFFVELSIIKEDSVFVELQ